MNTLVSHALAVLISVWIMLCTGAHAVDVKTVDDAVVQKALRATVLINTYTGPEAGHAALGYFASADGLVVTTTYTVEGAQKLILLLADGSTISNARLLGMDKNKRLAVLATNRKPPVFLEPCGGTSAVGDACVVVGLRQTDRALLAAFGQLLARHPTLNYSETQFVDAWSVGARHDCVMPGGAVVNTSGQVIGVWERCDTREKQWITRAVPEADIHDALKKARQATQSAPFPRLGEINPVLASPAQSDPDYLEGVQSMKRGEYPAAIQKFTDTLRRYPKDAPTLSGLATCYSNIHQIEAAARCVKELAETNVQQWTNRVGIAGMLFNIGYDAAASEHLQAVLKEEPRLGNAWTLHAAVLKSLGRKQEALEAAKRGAELEPESLWSWTTLSDVFLNLGDLKGYQEARERADDLESLLFKLEHLPLRGLKVN